MDAKVKLISSGMTELLRDAGVRAMLTEKMGPVLAAAQAGAPIGRARPDHKPGTYKASLHIVQATTDRAVVRVVSDVPYAMSVEASSGNLARALNAAGGA